jgi:uncharacterized protein YdaU (DUF1376 family)
MHYYQFNIADYRKDTQHLNPMEHYIYRELMDWYYLDEQPIPPKTQLVTRRLRLGSEDDTMVNDVLHEFFIKTEKGWVHGRINHEIKQYHQKAETARINGAKGGRPKKPRKTKGVNLANPEITQGKANHKPLTSNHKPKSNGRFAPPAQEELTKYIGENNYHVDPDKFLSHYQAKGWMIGKNKMKDWRAAVRGWHARDKTTEPSAFSGSML